MEQIGKKVSDSAMLGHDVLQFMTLFLTGKCNVKMFIQSFEVKNTPNISTN